MIQQSLGKYRVKGEMRRVRVSIETVKAVYFICNIILLTYYIHSSNAEGLWFEAVSSSTSKFKAFTRPCSD